MKTSECYDGKTKLKRKRPWSSEINTASKKSKLCFHEWKEAGRPNEPENEKLIAMKTAKKVLRRTQRQYEASLRNQKYEQNHVRLSHEGDQKLFYKLINEQRKDGNKTTTSITINGTILSNVDDIREGWADYFQKLATPQISETHDNSYDKSSRFRSYDFRRSM